MRFGTAPRFDQTKDLLQVADHKAMISGTRVLMWGAFELLDEILLHEVSLSLTVRKIYIGVVLSTYHVMRWTSTTDTWSQKMAGG